MTPEEQKAARTWARYGYFGLNEDRSIILAGRDPKVPAFRLIVRCIGRKRHYRRDGVCDHARAFVAALKPWYRARTQVLAWAAP